MTTSAPAYLSYFGATAIPNNRGRFAWPVISRQTTAPTIGGAFRGAGLANAGLQLPYSLSYTGAAVNATDTSAVLTLLDALRAKVGEYGVLQMQMTDTTVRWCMAELANVSPDMVATDRAVVMFNLTFNIFTGWGGAVHGAWPAATGPDENPIIGFTSGLYARLYSQTSFTSSPQTITLTNGGNRVVKDAGIVVEAGSSITYLKLTTALGVGYEYTGTIAAGKMLVIDCGAKTITNDDTDAFVDWHRLATHTRDTWLYLPISSETVTLTYTGGANSKIQFVYADGWA